MNSKLGRTTEQDPISKKIKTHKMEVKTFLEVGLEGVGQRKQIAMGM